MATWNGEVLFVMFVVFSAIITTVDGQVAVVWGNEQGVITDAANAAVEKVFQETGWRGQLVQETDLQSTDSPAKIVSKLCTSISSGGILGILGPTTSEQAVVVGRTAAINNLPIVSHSATSSDLTDAAGFTTLSRSISLDAVQVKALLSFATKLGFTSCGILYSQDAYGVGILRRISDSNSILFTAIPIATNATTFSTEVKTLLYQHQQSLVLIVTGAIQTGLVLNEAQASGNLAKAGWLVSEAATGNLESSGFSGDVKNILGVRPIVTPIAGVADTLYAKTAYFATKILLETIFDLGLHTNPGDRYSAADCMSGSSSWVHGKQVSDVVRQKAKVYQNGMWELVNYQSGGWVRVGNRTEEETHVDSESIKWSTHKFPNPASLLTGDHLRILFPCNVAGLSDQTESGNSGTGILWDIVKNISAEYYFSYSPFISCYECDHSNCVEGNNLDQLSKGEFDVFAVALTVTPARQDFLDFTFPWATDAKRLLVLRQAEEETNLWRFLEPMEGAVYVSIIICVLVCGLALWIIEANRNPEIAVQGGLVSTLWLAFTHTFLINQDNPFTETGRILASGYLILATVFLAAYTAELTSFLTNAEDSLYAANKLEQFLTGEVPIHLLGVELDSAVDGILTDSIQVSGYRLIRNQTEAHNLLRSGVISAFIESMLYFDFHRECDLELRGPEISQLQEFKAFALPKGSPLTSAFDRAIVYLSHVRGSDTIRAAHVAATEGINCPDDEESDEATGMSLEAMYGPLIVTGGIFAAAFLLRLVRFVRNYFHKRRLAKTKVRWASRLSLLPSKSIMELALGMMPVFTASQARTRKELVDQIVSRLLLLVKPAGYETHIGVKSLLIISSVLKISLKVETSAREMAELVREKLDGKLNAEERLRAERDGGASFLSLDLSQSVRSDLSTATFEPLGSRDTDSVTSHNVTRTRTQPLSQSDKRRRSSLNPPSPRSSSVEPLKQSEDPPKQQKKLSFSFNAKQRKQQRRRERSGSFKNNFPAHRNQETPLSGSILERSHCAVARQTTQPQGKLSKAVKSKVPDEESSSDEEFPERSVTQPQELVSSRKCSPLRTRKQSDSSHEVDGVDLAESVNFQGDSD